MKNYVEKNQFIGSKKIDEINIKTSISLPLKIKMSTYEESYDKEEIYNIILHYDEDLLEKVVDTIIKNIVLRKKLKGIPDKCRIGNHAKIKFVNSFIFKNI